MSMRHRIVIALVRIYPAAWRREYGDELADLLLAGSLGPRVVANVLLSGILQRIRGTETRSLWARVFVAFVAMEAVATTGFAAKLSYSPNNEFGGPMGATVVAAIVSIPFCLGALTGVLVPATVLLKPLRRSPTLPKAISAGLMLSVPAFAVVVFGGWLIDGENLSLAAFVNNVLRFPITNAILLAAFATGGAILFSNQPREGGLRLRRT